MSAEVLRGQEEESHRQISDLVVLKDLEAASKELRVELIEFMEPIANEDEDSPGPCSVGLLCSRLTPKLDYNQSCGMSVLRARRAPHPLSTSSLPHLSMTFPPHGKQLSPGTLLAICTLSLRALTLRRENPHRRRGQL